MITKKKKEAPKVASIKKEKTKKVSSLGAKGSSKKKLLVHAMGERCFWVEGGQVLCSLPELAAALKKMTPEQFCFYVTKEKNDFSLWAEHVLGDKECATELRKAKNAKDAAKVAEKHMKKYTY